MVKKLQDFCLSCIARNITSYNRLGNYLSPRLKEVLLERMCWHKLLLPSNTASILYHLISHTLQRVNLSYSEQVNDGILALLGDSGCLLNYLTIQSCPNVTDKGVAALGRVLRKVKGFKLKKISRDFKGKGLESIKSRTLSEVNLKENHSVEDIWIITLINNCPNITKLYLCELFKVTNKAVVHIAKVLGSKLVALDIGELNLITSVSTVALAEHCPNLSDVKLESCVKLDGSGLVQMAERCSISTLCVSFCYKVTKKSCDIIVSLLRAKGLLQRLDAIGLAMSLLGMEMLYSTSSITSLVLCGVPTINDDVVEKITKSMGHTLTEFDISTCELLTDQSCASIANNCMALKVLGLCNLKNVTGSDLIPFFMEVKNANQFRSISLSGSKKVSRAVVETIVNCCPELEVLTIAGVKDITDVIPEALARNCQKLKNASFKNCDLTDEGVCLLAVHCSDIVLLALSGIHDLTDLSIIALAENCPKLRELYISGCDKITKQAVAYLQDCAVGRVHVSHSTPSAPEGLLMAKDLDAGEYRRMDLLDYDSLRTLDRTLAV